MPIYTEGKEIKNIYSNGKKIDKVYSQGNLLYQAQKAPTFVSKVISGMADLNTKQRPNVNNQDIITQFVKEITIDSEETPSAWGNVEFKLSAYNASNVKGELAFNLPIQELIDQANSNGGYGKKIWDYKNDSELYALFEVGGIKEFDSITKRKNSLYLKAKYDNNLDKLTFTFTIIQDTLTTFNVNPFNGYCGIFEYITRAVNSKTTIEYCDDYPYDIDVYCQQKGQPYLFIADIANGLNAGEMKVSWFLGDDQPQTPQRGVLLGGYQGAYIVLDKTGLREMQEYKQNATSTYAIQTAIKLNNGNILVAGSSGRYAILNSTGEVVIQAVKNDIISTNTIYTLTKRANGQIFVGGAGGRYGILSADGTQVLVTNILAGGTGAIITSCLADNGDILFGNGADYRKLTVGDTITYIDSMAATIYAIEKLANGKYIIGDGASNYRIINASVYTISQSNKQAFGSTRIQDIKKMHDNRLFLLCYDGRYLILSADGSAVSQTAKTSIVGINAFKLLVLENGNILIAGYDQYGIISADGTEVLLTNAKTPSTVDKVFYWNTAINI